MQQGVYAVFDSAAAAYLRPFVADTDLLARRAFEGAVRDPSHPFNIHAADHFLFKLGEFDQLTGELHPTTPLRIEAAIETKARLSAQENNS